MEGNPLRLVRKHQARRDHELGEIVWQYPNFLVSLKIDARLLQELDGFRREHVFAGGPAISKRLSTTPLPPLLLPRRASNGWGGGRKKDALDAKMKIELPGRHVLGVVSV